VRRRANRPSAKKPAPTIARPPASTPVLGSEPLERLGATLVLDDDGEVVLPEEEGLPFPPPPLVVVSTFTVPCMFGWIEQT
jgi:hypothetical protein